MPRAEPIGLSAAERRALLVTAACALGVVAVYLVGVRTALGQRIDDAPVLRHNLDRLRDVDVSTADVILTIVGIHLVPVVAWLGRRQARRLGLLALAAVGCVAVARVTQVVFPHPDLERFNPVYQGPFNPLYGATFPSGHAAGSMAVALALVTVAPGRRWARTVAVAASAAVMALALGFPIHRPSDLLAGLLIALGSMTFAVLVAARFAPPAGPPPVVGGGSGRIGPSVLRVVCIAGVLLLCEEAELRLPGLTLADLGWSLPIAVIALTAAAEATVAVFIRVSAGPLLQVGLDDGPEGGRRAGVVGHE